MWPEMEAHKCWRKGVGYGAAGQEEKRKTTEICGCNEGGHHVGVAEEDARKG